MAFLLNGQPLPVDTPFTTPDGTQYSALFLRHSTLEEKLAIGITEVPDPPAPPDQRFYWGLDDNGVPIPRDPEQVKAGLIRQCRQAAGTLLAPTDWLIIRQQETGEDAPEEVLRHRQAVRAASNAYVEAVRAAATLAELQALPPLQWPAAPERSSGSSTAGLAAPYPRDELVVDV